MWYPCSESSMRVSHSWRPVAVFETNLLVSSLKNDWPRSTDELVSPTSTLTAPYLNLNSIATSLRITWSGESQASVKAMVHISPYTMGLQVYRPGRTSCLDRIGSYSTHTLISLSTLSRTMRRLPMTQAYGEAGFGRPVRVTRGGHLSIRGEFVVPVVHLGKRLADTLLVELISVSQSVGSSAAGTTIAACFWRALMVARRTEATVPFGKILQRGMRQW